MRKILALFIVAAMMLCAVLPASAAPQAVTDREKGEIYQAFLRQSYEAVTASTPNTMQGISFEAFAANRPIENLEAFMHYGRFGAQQYPVVFISTGTIFGYSELSVGDYIFDFEHYNAACDTYDTYLGGLYVYNDEKLVLMQDAYKTGMMTDADLKEMFTSGALDGMMWRFGDMDNNKKLDVADIMGIKQVLLNPKMTLPARGGIADFSRDGQINIGDILELKSHIMQNA